MIDSSSNIDCVGINKDISEVFVPVLVLRDQGSEVLKRAGNFMASNKVS